MSRNRNVGRNAAQNNALVLQAKPQIEKNEFGLLQCTLNFHLRDDRYPLQDPARGTPCDEFNSGDAKTTAVLAELDYLGAQSSRFIRSGFASGKDNVPGIGILQVLCQGAKTTLVATRSISSIFLTSRGSNYRTLPTVRISSTGEVSPAIVEVRLHLQLATIVSGGTNYAVGDVLQLSGGDYETPVELTVTVIGTGGSIKPSDGGKFTVSDHGSYLAIPAGTLSLTGGSGSGATMSATFCIGEISILFGGVYTTVPNATLQGGNPDTPGALGSVSMGNSGTNNVLGTTEPWKPVSTTKDMVQFVTYGFIDPVNSAIVKYATTGDLGPAKYYTESGGSIRLEQTSQYTSPLTVDGTPVSVGDTILVRNESNAYRNGIYKVVQTAAYYVGPNVKTPWILERLTGFDTASAFNTSLHVLVLAGLTQGGSIWACISSVTTLAGSDSSGGDSITFDSSTTSISITPQYRVTIDYHAIDLHFEYVCSEKLQQPLFIVNDYSIDESGYITIDISTGEKMILKIDSVVSEIVTVDLSGNVGYNPTYIPIDRSVWQNQVRFEGTPARFEQTQAGQHWHVLETATIKIVPVLASP